MPTIKVPDDLHSRIHVLAAAAGTTMANVISHSLDVMEESEFWAAVERTMIAPTLAADAEKLSETNTDGLDPQETWEGVL